MSWYCKMSEEIPVSSDSPGREGSKGWVKFEDGDGGATPAGMATTFHSILLALYGYVKIQCSKAQGSSNQMDEQR